MQLLEVKNDIAKIVYNPAENHLLPSDFLLIEDFNQKLISQIINIETTDDSNNNLAVLRLVLSIDKEDNLSLYNGYIPAKSSKIIYINPDEIIELIKGNGINIYFGNLSNHSNCFVKPSISFLNDKLYIQSDRDDKTNIIIRNLICELQNKNKKVLLIDFDGRYNSVENSVRLKITQNFKLPLNIDAFSTILENDIVDCPIEDKAVIQSIVLELREYLKTIPEKFLPFTRFKNVVDDEFLSNPVSGLMLFRNKLWLYSQDNIFAEDVNQFNILNKLFESTSTIIVDASCIEEKWYKFVIQTLLNLINIPCYVFISLNDILIDKKSIINLYNKDGIIPVVSSSYDCNYRQILKSICKNQILCKSSKIQPMDENYSIFLNRMNASEIILYGEATLYLPLIVELKSFTPSTAEELIDNEIKKDVDKLLSSSQTVISPETIVKEISIPEEKTDDEYKIIEEDDLTDSDLDFLDESLNQNYSDNDEDIIDVEPEKYDLFSPIDVDEEENVKEQKSNQEINIDAKTDNIEEDSNLKNQDAAEILDSDELTHKDADSLQYKGENEQTNHAIESVDNHLDTENIDQIEVEDVGKNEEKQNEIIDELWSTDTEEQISSKDNVKDNENTDEQISSKDNVKDNENTDEQISLKGNVKDYEHTNEQVSSKENVNANEHTDEQQITAIDEVIQTITDKLDSNADNNSSHISEEKIENQLTEEQEVEEEPPEINENINEKKSVDIPIYETDNSSSMLIEDIPFKIGDKVYHPKHGYGIIEGFANYSNKILFCQIEFENVGRRILDPRISGIVKVS